MNARAKLSAWWRDIAALPYKSETKDRERYMIRQRGGLYYSDAGSWVKSRDRAKSITGSEAAWIFAEENCWEYIEEIDVIPAN